jgi:hypothetical protein
MSRSQRFHALLIFVRQLVQPRFGVPVFRER